MAGLGSTTLTDESQQLSSQILETKKEIEKQQAALADAKEKHAAVVADLTAGIGALKEARDILSNKGMLIDSKVEGDVLIDRAFWPNSQQSLQAQVSWQNRVLFPKLQGAQ